VQKDMQFFRNPKACFNDWQGNLTDTFIWNFLGANSTKYSSYLHHAMFYNEENLKYRLIEAGFSRIERKEFNQTEYEEFEDEHKFFPGHKFPRVMDDTNLIIEARK
jgi:hypothetical protein